MPIYTYIEEATGRSVERYVHHARDRDAQPGLRRTFSAPRFVVSGHAANPHDFETQVRRGLSKMEDSAPRTLERETQFSLSQLKQIWSN